MYAAGVCDFATGLDIECAAELCEEVLLQGLTSTLSCALYDGAGISIQYQSPRRHDSQRLHAGCKHMSPPPYTLAVAASTGVDGLQAQQVPSHRRGPSLLRVSGSAYAQCSSLYMRPLPPR